MIVVADTSPIHYLVLIGHVEVLINSPEWLAVNTGEPAEDISLRALDRGDRHAIALAQRCNAERLIVDDGAARREALSRGIPLIGLLGVIAEASRRKLISLPVAIMALQGTSF
jgi:predicted nucleic acid-binding protein